MTQESPEYVSTNPLYCDDCGKDLDLEHNGESLVATCWCGAQSEINQSETFPEAWL